MQRRVADQVFALALSLVDRYIDERLYIRSILRVNSVLSGNLLPHFDGFHQATIGQIPIAAEVCFCFDGIWIGATIRQPDAAPYSTRLSFAFGSHSALRRGHACICLEPGVVMQRRRSVARPSGTKDSETPRGDRLPFLNGQIVRPASAVFPPRGREEVVDETDRRYAPGIPAAPETIVARG